MAIYWQYESIDGEVTTSPYQKWIEVNSVHYQGVARLAPGLGSAVSEVY